MKKCLRRIIWVTTLLLAGCAGSPSDKQAQTEVASMMKEYGDLTDFRKTNGENIEVRGQKTYIFHFRAATKLGVGWVWIHRSIWTSKRGLVRGKPVDDPTAKRVSVPEGSTYIVEGTVTFRYTENGWVFNEAEIDQYGYCFGLSPTDCYKKLWGQK